MPACFPSKVDRGDGAALAPQKSETSPMPTKKPLTAKRRNTIKRQKCKTIVEEVENLEDLGPRMQELVSTSPEGTRIYLSVRNPVTVH
jgi:hypothetical protein